MVSGNAGGSFDPSDEEKLSFEEKLSVIAGTYLWDFPDEVTRFCDVMDDAVCTLRQVEVYLVKSAFRD